MRLTEIYAIDLRQKDKKILIFDQDCIDQLKKDNSVNNVLELSNYDVKLFKHWHEASKFLDAYLKAEQRLDQYKIKKDTKKMPKILYKRRYMIQSLIGKKNQTVRDSKRVNKMMSTLNIGDHFKLYDQTFEITVKLTKATYLTENSVRYDFKIA